MAARFPTLLNRWWLRMGLLIAVFLAASTVVLKAEMTLDFSEGHTLKGLFDAGMRPYREPHSQRFGVAVEKIAARIKLPSGMVIGGREWTSMQFSVINDGRLTSARMRSVPLTLDEARSAMLPLLSIAGDGTAEALDAFLQKVRSRYFFYEGDFHIGTGKKQNPRFLGEFSRTGLKEHPLALLVSLEWRLEPRSAERSFYKVPIPPPPGYEDVSMDKPPFVATSAESMPTAAPSTPAQVPATPSTVPMPPSPSPKASVMEKPSSSMFPIIPLVIGLVLILIVVWVSLNGRKSRRKDL